MVGQYQRGYIVELRAIEKLRRGGYATFRSAKSGGPFDIGGTTDSEILFIQVKREKKPSKDPIKKYAKDITRLQALPSPGCVRKEFWVWTDRAGWRKFGVG